MSEIRRLNDARREGFCRPGAEEDEFFICDLGTPWCSVDHDEAWEIAMLEQLRREREAATPSSQGATFMGVMLLAMTVIAIAVSIVELLTW